MDGRRFDVVVFGSSGYTGCYVVQELINFPKDIKWCCAGRNVVKVKGALEVVAKLTDKNLDDIEILEVDIDKPETILNMCKQTKLVLNCVGPYRFFGEQIVSACVETGTHHIDVSGEPQFLESMQVKYFNAAKEKKIAIVGACGFDSIPCDLGIEVLKQKFDGDVNSVETYLQFKGTKNGNFGTWQSAVHGLAHSDELKPLRKQMKETIFTKEKPKSSFPQKKRPYLFKSDLTNKWCIPFIGSDRSIVLRTQMYNYQFKNERPSQVQTYMCMPSLINALGTMFMGLIFMVMTRFACGRDLLEKYPEFFSCGTFTRTPPPLKKKYDGSFKMTMFANGWSERLQETSDSHTDSPNKNLKLVVNGPDPYEATAICVVNSAVVLLSETEKLPDLGGVFTPGAAFKHTSLANKLEERGLTFQVIT